MKRPSKKDIKAAVDKLKLSNNAAGGTNEEVVVTPTEKKGSQRIRKRTI
ncbi:hypothetical protein [Fimbriimonas ginsengisoli]|uniref:Uncharacterized protein n=1 Tax=Fimbriimonas ginsengisoli Gsoil 348 TaxID=661478 RepID=A0A068NSD0_FIMGI|nr:hypothetical protein [Fimbriimonas ginsengisoli]AIE86257.1 hypothetical protein OP10G_2889 [Fimbriimonas ginsengisoli Gsoil 348]